MYKAKSEMEGNFDSGKHEKLLKKPLMCSHIIAIGMARDPKESVPEVEEVAAVSCAVQNMMLTAASNGVGCYWGTGGITFYPEAKEFFGLGEKDKFLGFLFLGMPKKWPEGRRGSVADKVKFMKD